MIVVRSLRSSRSKGEPDSFYEMRCTLGHTRRTSGHTICRPRVGSHAARGVIGMLSEKRPMVLMYSGLQLRRSQRQTL